VHVDDDRGRGAGLRQLRDAEREGDRVQARAAELSRYEDAHQPGVAGGLNGLLWEAMISVNLGRVRLDHALRELAHGRAEGLVVGRQL
jgi:hypothetical protein